MHYAFLAADFVCSFYVTFGLIAGTFDWAKYHNPWSRWSHGKITKREMATCMIVAIPLTPVVAACLGSGSVFRLRGQSLAPSNETTEFRCCVSAVAAPLYQSRRTGVR
jgi:hypothetical protein